MAFSYDGSGLPSLLTYTDALKFWEGAAKWRDEDNERILDSRKKRRVNIRMLRDGSVACRLHNTDVVTYHPDNRMTLVPWASVSTDEFANRLLRWTNINTYFKQGILRVGGKIYRATGTITLAYNPDTKGYAIISAPEPFTSYTVNRKEANAVLKEHNYKAFANWVRMLAVSGVQFEPNRRCAIIDVPRYLADRAEWESLLSVSYHWHTRGKIAVDVTLSNVRYALYQDNPQVYDSVTVPYLTEWKEVERWKRNSFKY